MKSESMITFNGNTALKKAYDDVSGSGTPDTLALDVLDWSPNYQQTGRSRAFPSAATLIHNDRNSPSPFQVVFAPYQPRCSSEWEGMQLLKAHYQLPSTVLAERKQNVTHAFGATSLENDQVEIAWCHFLSKDLAVQDTAGELRILENGIMNDCTSQANSSWIVSEYWLHIRRNHSLTSNALNVTLLCFGAPPRVVERFRQSLGHPMTYEICQDTFQLFDIIYEELHQVVDDRAWMLADVFRPVERATLESAQDTTSTNAHVDFAGLHNATKHCTYLQEAVKAACKTLDAMIEHLETTTSYRSPHEIGTRTVAALRYRKRIFQSTALRLESLDKRMANIISLSFHLVNQANSRLMRHDSGVMKTIAVMTLIFLPAMGVASVFSSPFFSVDFDKAPEYLQVATSFWIFWILVLPLTFGVGLLWWRWYKAHKRGQRKTGDVENRGILQSFSV